MNNTQNINIEELNEQLNSMASILADGYIARNKKPSVKEMCEADNVPYVVGKLYGAHIQALQIMMIEEHKLMGLDLEAEVKKTGEAFKPGTLSKYEAKILANKLENITFYTERLIQIKENKQ